MDQNDQYGSAGEDSSEEESTKTKSEGSMKQNTSATSEPPVTEPLVPTRRKISKYIVSVDESTGTPVKIEKLDEKSGKRTELSQAEYAAAFTFASYSAPYYASNAAMYYDPMNIPAMQAYWAYLKSVSDYWKHSHQPSDTPLGENSNV